MVHEYILINVLVKTFDVTVLEVQRYLQTDDALFPGAKSREINLPQGFVRELQVYALCSYGELERNSLMCLSHPCTKHTQKAISNRCTCGSPNPKHVRFNLIWLVGIHFSQR